MRSICLRLAKCRHDTLIQSKRKQQIAIFLQFYASRYASHLRYFSYDLAIFISFSPFSFYETARLFKNCSFFKICAFIIAFKRNINSRIYPTEKCREKHGVIRHLDALIWPTLSKRFAFALYQPWYDRCLRPPSRIEPSMRVKFDSKRRSPVCIQLISCTVLKREICYV